MSEGRFPANVILDPAMAEALDGQSGYQRDGVAVKRNGGGAHNGEYVYDGGWGSTGKDQTYGSGGGASRFFVQAGYDPDELAWIYANGLTPHCT